MSTLTPYDVFISYRRESGSEKARLLLEALNKRGYRVFLDVKDLKQGHFDEALLREIGRIPSFLVVLSPGSLDRCVHEGDWLRIEIAQALATKRNIVPVTFPGFVFPEVGSLPEELRTLPRHQAVEYTHLYFDASMERLCTYLGHPLHGVSFAKRFVLKGAVLIAAVANSARRNRPAPVVTINQASHGPVSSQDLAFLRSLANDMCSQLVQVNTALGYVQRFSRDACALFKETSPDGDDVLALIDQCHFHLTQLDHIVPPAWKNDRSKDLDRLGISSAEIHAFYAACLTPYWDSARDFFRKAEMRARLRLSPGVTPGPDSRLTELRMESVQCEAQLMHYFLLGMLNGFPPDGLGDFQGFRSQWTNLPNDGLLSKDDSESLAEKMVQRIQKILNEITEIAGTEAGEVRELSRQLEQQKAAGTNVAKRKP